MLAFNTPMQSSLQIAKRARSQRLSQNLSRKTLAKIFINRTGKMHNISTDIRK
jgi:hypothetical protein